MGMGMDYMVGQTLLSFVTLICRKGLKKLAEFGVLWGNCWEVVEI